MPTIDLPADKQHFARQLPGILAGTVRDSHGIRKAFLSTFVYSLMDQVGTAFAAKSDGGTDNLGHRFKPLAEKTVDHKSTARFHRKYPLSLPHQIMRASNRLITSFSAGMLSGDKYIPPKNQVVQFKDSVIKIYSRLPYTGFQFTKRPFWTENIDLWIAIATNDAIQAVVNKIKTIPTRNDW